MQIRATRGIYRAKGENQTKIYLFGYRSLLRRQEALLEALDEYREMATRATSRIKAVNVSGTNYCSPLETNAIKSVDGERKLKETIEHISVALAGRLALIDGLTDERHKEILTMRYITGLGWDEIASRINYDRRWMFRLHGEALEAVRAQMSEKAT